MYWKRCLGYLCLALALALSPPQLAFDDLTAQNRQLPALYLQAVALTPEALSPLCSATPIEFNQALTGEFSKIAKSAAQLAEQGPSARVYLLRSEEPTRMLAKMVKPGTRAMCFKMGGAVFLLSRRPAASSIGGYLELVGLDESSAPSSPALTPEQLAAYPALAKRVNELKGQAARASARARGADQRVPYSAELDRLRYSSFEREVPLKMAEREWQALAKALGQEQGTVRFRAAGYLFLGRPDMVWERVKAPVQWLGWARWILAGVLFLAALWIMCWAYRAGSGLRINPAWSAVFADVMFVLLLSMGAFGVLDYALQNWPGMTPKLEEALHLMYLPVLLLLAAFAVVPDGQSLEITAEGLTRHGSGRAHHLAWNQITGFELEEMNIPVARAGFVFARRLQTMLEVQADGGGFSVMEPGLRSTKRALIAGLADHAPDRLQDQIQAISRAW